MYLTSKKKKVTYRSAYILNHICVAMVCGCIVDFAAITALSDTQNTVATIISSFYWASVANAPNILQPYWLIVLPLDVPAPSGQRWRCLWTFLFSNVPTFATSRLQEILAEKWPMNFAWKMPDFHVTFRDLLHGTDGFASPPKEGVLRIFFALKNLTASAGFEPANLSTKGQHATSRPPKPL